MNQSESRPRVSTYGESFNGQRLPNTKNRSCALCNHGQTFQLLQPPRITWPGRVVALFPVQCAVQAMISVVAFSWSTLHKCDHSLHAILHAKD